MQRIKKLIMVACAALCVALSAGAARACADWFMASDGTNRALCDLAGSTSTGCTYVCSCYGDCSGIYRSMGLKKIN
jgi:hypothetical protein